jgi:hypothetical protein
MRRLVPRSAHHELAIRVEADSMPWGPVDLVLESMRGVEGARVRRDGQKAESAVRC